ncbi:MAG: hypothetical protein O7C39_07255 [Bacteroidetes bacterium]|nr:hypothetical protein [Bacteroidota bacterium]
MFYGKRFLIVLITLVSAIVWQGCSDTVIDPFSNDGKYYTIYGFLDVLETEHTVRVIPVTRHAERISTPSDPQADIDARVFSTDLRTGYRREWSHSLVQTEDGSYGHIFKSQFIVNPLRTYRLEVVRSDGKMATAETTVPYIPDAALFEKGPEVFSPDSTELYQDIYIPRIASPWDIQGIYLWGGGGTINRRVYVQHGRSGYRTADGGWQMRLTISEDQAVVRENIQWSIDTGDITEATLVGITALGVQLRILDQDWDPPAGVFDPEVLSAPGAFSNVINGYGRFGSIGLYIQEWNAEHLSVALGYDF